MLVVFATVRAARPERGSESEELSQLLAVVGSAGVQLGQTPRTPAPGRALVASWREATRPRRDGGRDTPPRLAHPRLHG